MEKTVKQLQQKIYELESEIDQLKKDNDLLAREKCQEENEEKYRTLINNQTDLVIKANTKGEFLFVSPTCCDLFGKTVDELHGSTYMPLVHKEDQKKTKEAMKKLFTPPHQAYVEQRALTKQGWRWLAWKGSVILDDNNNVKEIIGIGRDITEKKEAEFALKESEEKFKSIFFNCPLGIFLVNKSFKIVDVNNQLANMLGYSKQEFIGSTFRPFTHPDDYLKDYKPALKVLRGEIEGYNIEKRYLKKDGSTIWGHLVASKIADENGNFKFGIGMVEDTTERKKMEESLAEGERTLSLALEGANLAFWDQNFITGKIKRNDRWFEMLGYKPGELDDSLSILELMHPDDAERAKEKAEKHKRGEISVFRAEHRLKTKKGDWKWILNWGKIFERDKNGNPVRAIGIHMDINTRKLFEQELIKAKDRAEESDRLKSAFLANMSHEIRTPMNGIIGFSNMMTKRDLSKEKQNYYANIIVDSSKQLLTIVNDILDISRIETGKISVIKHEVNINETLMELFDFFQPKSNKMGISLFAHKELADEQSKIFTDKTRLKQILTNLINNSLKFTTKGFIKFGYHLKENDLLFFVEDTGIGIEKEMQAKVFERFRQVEAHLSRKHGGTGLGLSISKRLVELLGGDIWVESRLDEGSCFYFTLPYHPLNTNIEIPKLIEQSKKKQTVLVAEDEEINFLFIEELLTEKNLNIIHAKNGLETIKHCENNPNIDLVLMDIKMPKLNGLEATKKIREFRPTLPIIAQTAYAMFEDKQKSMEAGCNEYVSKPIEREKFISIIEKYLTPAD